MQNSHFTKSPKKTPLPSIIFRNFTKPKTQLQHNSKLWQTTFLTLLLGQLDNGKLPG